MNEGWISDGPPRAGVSKQAAPDNDCDARLCAGATCCGVITLNYLNCEGALQHTLARRGFFFVADTISTSQRALRRLCRLSIRLTDAHFDVGKDPFVTDDMAAFTLYVTIFNSMGRFHQVSAV